MNQSITTSADYVGLFQTIKQRIQSAQIKASVAVNTTLLALYWDMAKLIVEKQQTSQWGDGFLAQMSQDLQRDFPQMKGFSKRNLEVMRQWYLFWKSEPSIAQQLVAQIPWSHNQLILNKFKAPNDALFYVQKTIQNNWSRTVLSHQIESGLHLRAGQSINNFHATLPAIQSDLANQMLKDPYHFDFLMLSEKHNEQELENALIEHITKFLLELGSGFAYIGRQYKLEINEDSFYLDLLFYHIHLRCYVVIELKTVKFQPEFAGKLNFYVSVVDGLLKTPHDNPSIGILICKSKNNTVVEYALKDIHKPLGISEYRMGQPLPENIQSVLPSIELIEAELEKYSLLAAMANPPQEGLDE